MLWGFFPIYFKLLRPSPPLEILAHRVIWSVRLHQPAAARHAQLALPRAGCVRDRAAARRDHRSPALLIGVNWATYIYGVNSSRVVETALGYFITPLVVVLLGVTVQRERLRPWQWVASASARWRSPC